MSDIATPGPIDPTSGQPDRRAEVSAVKTWLRQNAVTLAITALACGLVVYYLDVIDTAKVVVGLGFIIFIHELGHFLAAKWCDVHVKTFSIGFGPAVPFCSYKWGETTYMVGIIPLGGYVSMVGEGQAGEASPEYEPDEDDDPRSFRKKSVGQRMLIISAGVIMNVAFGMACFAAAYLHGVQEKPATIGWVESGSAAWRAGIRTGADIEQIDGRRNPMFNDLRPVVMSTRKGETVSLVVEYKGHREALQVEPLRDERAYYPQLGIVPPSRLTLFDGKRRGLRPVVPGTPAAAARDPGFEPGDRVVAMTDPADPATVTPIPPDESGKPDFEEYHRRMVLLAGQPITLHVVRKNGEGPIPVTVAPAYRADLGVRMLMGEVVAVRRGGPAERAGVRPHTDSPPATGDKIAAVGVTDPDGKRTWFANGTRPPEAKDEDALKPLDPVLLPLELNRWAGRFPPQERDGLKIELVVLRELERAPKRVALTLDYDDSYRFDREVVNLPNSPLPVGGLGLAYWIEAVVTEATPGGPAAAAGLQLRDLIEAVRFKSLDDAGNVKAGDWEEIKPHQWAWAETAFQARPPFEVDLRVRRGDEVIEVSLAGRPDTAWPTEDRGLLFQVDYRVQKAEDIGDALALGAYRTVRFIKEVYLNLYAMIFGRVSAKTMSGPLTIATVSYKIAGEDFWQFLLFLGLISVNLAVVNFLPIPVLDGGHMVFLILEKVLGRPVPERLFAAAMYTGLFLILLLMAFVLWLDIRRLFFGWF